MEKKKVQRVIGVLVIVAIIIILIPFIFGKKEEGTTTTQEATPLTAPASSEQQTPTNSSDSTTLSPTDSQSSNTQSSTTEINTSSAQDNGITPIPSNPQNTAAAPANPTDTTNNAPSPLTQSDSSVQNTNTLSPANTTDSVNTGASNLQPTTTLDSHPNVKYTGNTVEVAPAQTNTNNIAAQNSQEITPAVAATINDAVQPQTKAENAAPVKPSNVIPATRAHKSVIAKKARAISEKQLANLKKPAWVVQMGSFKDKSNAHHLVDRLRAAGFKAFTHEVASSSGNSRTRVYIGPEFKEASAHKLSSRIEETTKLRGYVVPFKPMAL